MVSTRCLDAPCGGGDFQPAVFHYDGEGLWQPAPLDALLASPAMPTILFVHGNRMSFDGAVLSAWDLYYALNRGRAIPSVRVIIWSWPSDQLPGPIRDARVKADRADRESFYLAAFLGRYSATPDAPLSLLGYSFGCRVISGALHYANGGSLLGYSARSAEPIDPEQPSGDAPARVDRSLRSRSTRVALLAPAMDHATLDPSGVYGASIAAADRWLVLHNSCDPVLKRYRLLEPFPGVAAMGFEGPHGAFPDNAVWQLDVAPFVGRSHKLEHYFGSPAIIATLARYAIPAPP
ncbi:MAG: alpha/beta hydrolase [Planctomycetes bacterium]|nr:alpha/beta hydrolase [Planctomycetota bacterium]